jgi:hypothetical protein
MYNYSDSNATQVDKWRERINGLLNGSLVFFTGDHKDIMTEVACEPVDLCDLDQQSFKAYLARWMAATTKWAPWTYARVKPLLESSAIAAIATCTGGHNGRMCGLKWATQKWDGTQGAGQQMAAMEVILANTIRQSRPPVSNGTGGTSQGDPGAGGGDVGRTTPEYRPISPADNAGAYLITALIVLGLVSGSVFVLTEEHSYPSLSHLLVRLRSAIVMAGSWNRNLLKLRRQNTSRSKEKGVDWCNSYGRARNDTGAEKGTFIHSYNFPNPVDLHPLPKLYTSPEGRRWRSEPLDEWPPRRGGSTGGYQRWPRSSYS